MNPIAVVDVEEIPSTPGPLAPVSPARAGRVVNGELVRDDERVCWVSDLPRRIVAAHGEVLAANDSALLAARAAGDLLLLAKSEQSRGHFLPWLADNCPDVSERVAQGYMRVAREWDSLTRNGVSGLSLRKALKLLAKPAEPRPEELAPGGHDDDPTTVPVSLVPRDDRRMVRVWVRKSELDEFKAQLRELESVFGTSNLSETVLVAVRRAYEAR